MKYCKHCGGRIGQLTDPRGREVTVHLRSYASACTSPYLNTYAESDDDE